MTVVYLFKSSICADLKTSSFKYYDLLEDQFKQEIPFKLRELNLAIKEILSCCFYFNFIGYMLIVNNKCDLPDGCSLYLTIKLIGSLETNIDARKITRELNSEAIKFLSNNWFNTFSFTFSSGIATRF